MICTTVSIRSAPDNRATAVGWTSNLGRFGSDQGDWGFTGFAPAGVSSMVFIGVAALRSAKPGERSSSEQEPAGAH
jgi:AAHS family benzoate transporter-like MFS transporter